MWTAIGTKIAVTGVRNLAWCASREAIVDDPAVRSGNPLPHPLAEGMAAASNLKTTNS